MIHAIDKMRACAKRVRRITLKKAWKNQSKHATHRALHHLKMWNKWADKHRKMFDAEIRARLIHVGLCNNYSNWKRKHKPNLGPYSDDNPMRCVSCGKPLSLENSREECLPVKEVVE